jgi:glutamate decarboxylase
MIRKADSATQPASKKQKTEEGKQSYPERAARLCLDYLDSAEDTSRPVIELNSPDEIRSKYEAAGISLSLKDGKAHSDDLLFKGTELLMQMSCRTQHPLFFNQLYARASPNSIAADWVSTATNTNCHTYEVAPVFTTMEVEIFKKFASVLGGEYPNGHDGLFVPGGSISNLYGMHLAANRKDPKRNTRGAVGGPTLVAFVSDQAHYSGLKSARLLAIGSDNLVKVATNANGAMDAAALEKELQAAVDAGKTPFYIGGTAGTTVLGAYDPFVQMAALAKKFGCWMHVDGAWGGAAVFSKKHRHLVEGMEQADSIALNPHKLIGAPVQCSMFCTRYPTVLKDCNATSAKYLFQKDKLNVNFDSGDKTIQCGRKTDMFKMWVLWKELGDAGLERVVDRCFELRDFVANKIRSDKTGAWQLVYEPSCTNVCFWYVPKSLRPFNYAKASEDQKAALNKVAAYIKATMQREGDALIGFQAVNDRPNFFRLVFAGDRTSTEEEGRLTAMMARMAAHGEKA